MAELGTAAVAWGTLYVGSSAGVTELTSILFLAENRKSKEILVIYSHATHDCSVDNSNQVILSFNKHTSGVPKTMGCLPEALN